MQFDQFRWYYNATINTFYDYYGSENILNQRKYSSYTVRDLLRKYKYEEEQWTDNLIGIQFIYDEERNEIPVPEWWKGNVHNRLPRGAINKFVSSLNSAISNYKNGNIRKFNMRDRTKKNSTDYLHFEDKHFPSFIRKIKNRYWYTTRDHKRHILTLEDVETQNRGIEIIYDKITKHYYLHYPVDRDWFPNDDRRNDSQVALMNRDENRIISLDPGVRKFLVGYDPQGECIFIGEGANKELMHLLHEIDKTIRRKKRLKLWKKIQNMVSELHWKTIHFLIQNYDVILLPEFRVSDMVKGKKLSRSTKRMMLMYSFYKFKEKLQYKCKMYNKKLIIVDESYTSCTCTKCGVINNVKGREIYNCEICGFIGDRDVCGSRNIFIKNSTYAKG